jgi:hypothetical protein
MATEAEDVIMGVDVCKDPLDVFEQRGERTYSISNDAAAIKTWMDRALPSDPRCRSADGVGAGRAAAS